MSVETPDRAVFGELERELVQAARRRNAAGAAGPVRHRRRAPRAAGVLVPALAAAITIAVVVVAVMSFGRGHHARGRDVRPERAARGSDRGDRARARERAGRSPRGVQAVPSSARRAFRPGCCLSVAIVSTTRQLGSANGSFFPGANQVDLHSFWRVPGPPAAVIKWFESHPPQGWANSSTGSGGSGGTTLHWNVTFGFPTISGRTSSEDLSITTASARGGGTAVRVDVQTIWVIPRPHDSIVPATVDEIEWSSTTGSTSAVDHTFSSEANVRKLVGWLNTSPAAAVPGRQRVLLRQPGQRIPLHAVRRRPRPAGRDSDLERLWRSHARHRRPPLLPVARHRPDGRQPAGLGVHERQRPLAHDR